VAAGFDGLGLEYRELVEFFGEQVIEGDPRLVAIGLHLPADLHDRLVELGVGLGETELFLQERLAYAIALGLVGAGNEARILLLKRDAEMLDVPLPRRIDRLRSVSGHIGCKVMCGCHGFLLLGAPPPNSWSSSARMRCECCEIVDRNFARMRVPVSCRAGSRRSNVLAALLKDAEASNVNV